MRMVTVLAGAALLLSCTAQAEPAAQQDEAGPAPAAAEAVAPASPAPAGTATGEITAIAPAPADSVLYLDVRTPEEWRQGHVQGALLIPHDQIEQRWREIEAYRDRPVVVYCRSGRRSGLAIAALEQRGFSRLSNGGGLEQMAARGLPIVTGE